MVVFPVVYRIWDIMDQSSNGYKGDREIYFLKTFSDYGRAYPPSGPSLIKIIHKKAPAVKGFVVYILITGSLFF